MKLKKIVSLALAGVLAVSMLTACGDNGSSSSSSSEETTPATGVSATFASYLKNGKRITFEDSSTYQEYLASGIEKADLTYTQLGRVSAVSALATSAVPFNKVDDILDNSVIGYDATTTLDGFSSGSVQVKTDTTYVAMYQAPGKMDKNVVLKNIADDINADLADTVFVNFYNDGTDTYDYKYTGNVSMQKVEDGSASAWYVLIIVEVDATKTSK